MQRLVLAILLVAVLVVAIGAALAALRRSLDPSWPAGGAPAAGDGALQKTAYTLLIGLIGYVAIAGPG